MSQLSTILRIFPNLSSVPFLFSLLKATVSYSYIVKDKLLIHKIQNCNNLKRTVTSNYPAGTSAK